MLSLTDTTFDLLILELLLNATLLTFLLGLLGVRFPVDAGTENDVFADRGCVERWTGRVALFQTEFAPSSSLGDLRVYVLLDNGCADTSGDFDFFAVVVEVIRYDRLGAILVGCDLLRGQSRGVVKLLVVSPVGAAAKI